MDHIPLLSVLQGQPFIAFQRVFSSSWKKTRLCFQLLTPALAEIQQSSCSKMLKEVSSKIIRGNKSLPNLLALDIYIK
jgi:hypothetical protein